MSTTFKEPRGIVLHGLAVCYALGGYALGLYGLFDERWTINAAAVLLLAHAMTIAAYLIHECGHNSVFWSNAANARLGKLMSWVCGAAYGTYEDMRHKHFRHHVDNDDIIWFDHEAFLRRHPLLLRAVQGLEWVYIPAHDLMMHVVMALTSFLIPARREQRARNVAVLVTRLSIFFSVLYLAPKAALLYAVAYMLMMHVLRFMDSLQHDYGGNVALFTDDPAPRRGDTAWEQEHTFSNPQSLRHDWLNWFTLNFGFHNAHHARPTVPWYRLPALHRELFGNDPADVIPLRSQLLIYHKRRMYRVLHEGGDLDGLPSPIGRAYLEAARAGRLYGGNAVSFLTSF